MSININKFNDYTAYATSGNKPAGECCVSQIGNDVIYDGVNVVLKKEQLRDSDVCLTAIDSITNEVVYIPVSTYDSSTFDSDRYTFKNFIRFGCTNGKQNLISATEGSSIVWGAWNYYQIVCDLTADGGFTATITINGTARANTVSWSAGDTLASVIAQWTTVASTYFPTPVAGTLYSDGTTACINVRTGGYSNSTLTLSDNTGATLYDLSEVCRIDGTTQTEAHHTWQAQSVASMFSSLGFLSANTACYSNAGYNKTYRCIANKAKGLAYWRTSGSSSYVTENGNGIMNETAFLALNGSSTTAEQELYDKYEGSYEAYIEGQMVALDDWHLGGQDYRSYDNGAEQTAILASIETVDFDGEWIPAFPAAANAASVTDADFGTTYLPTCHEIALFMNDERMALINTAIEILNGTKLVISNYYWSVAEYSAFYSWFYYGNCGTLNNNGKYNSYRVRFLASV